MLQDRGQAVVGPVHPRVHLVEVAEPEMTGVLLPVADAVNHLKLQTTDAVNLLEQVAMIHH